MKNFFLIVFFIFFYLNYSYANNIFESKFYSIDISTQNVEKTKKDSINEVQIKSINNIVDRILTLKNKEKFIKIVNKEKLINSIIRNIIIENEIITNNKYKAEIKFNYDQNKIINIFRKNKINYSSLISEPFLVISSYNYNLTYSSLDNKNVFMNFIKQGNKLNNFLIQFEYPNLDANDRFILPYEKLMSQNHESFAKLSEKYNLNQILYIQIIKKNTNQHNVDLIIFDKNKNIFEVIKKFSINNNDNIDSDFLEKLTNIILIYIDTWWKEKVMIDNSFKNSINCNIQTQNFRELNIIKSKMLQLSQIDKIIPLKFKINNQLVNILFYGDINILTKSLYSKGIIMNYNESCTMNLYKS